MMKWTCFLLLVYCWRHYEALNLSDSSSQYHSLTQGSCPTNYLRCEFGENILEKLSDVKCFADSGLCNNVIDCSDGSDEKYCTNSSKYQFNYGSKGFHFRFVGGFCSTDSIMCLSQAEDPKCIPVASICNDVEDCADGSDERFCPYDSNTGFTYVLNRSDYSCQEDSYGCGYPSDYVCHHVSTLCDGVKNCYDNTDEAYCPYIFSSPEPHESSLSALEITESGVTEALPTNTKFESNISFSITQDSSPYVEETTPVLLPDPVYSSPFEMITTANDTVKEQATSESSHTFDVILPEQRSSSPFIVETTKNNVPKVTQTTTTPNSSAILFITPLNNLSQSEDVTMSTNSINNVENITLSSNQKGTSRTHYNDSLWHYLLISVVIVVIINTILIIVIFITLVRFYRYINSTPQKYRPNLALKDLYIWDDL